MGVQIKNCKMRTRRQGTTTEARRARMREYQKENYKTILAYQSEYKERRRKEDPLYEVEINNRRCIGYYITNNTPWREGSKAMELVGLPFEDYLKWIESQFETGMTWEKYGNKKGCWNIDHIVPPSTGTTQEEINSLFHFKNTRPLWKEANVRKSNF
jgi:hypothetical protein